MCLRNNSSFESKFLNGTLDSFLSQHVINFTRHTPGQRFSILDLIFTNNPNSIDSIKHFPPLASSDHDCLVFEYKCFTTSPSHEVMSSRYKYWIGDYSAMQEELDTIKWDNLFYHSSIETNWDLFKNIVLSLTDKFVPKVNKKAESNNPSLVVSHLNKAIKDKHRLYSQFKFTRSPLEYAKYASKRNNVKFLIRSAKAKYDDSLMQRFKSNPKALYS